MSSLFKKKQPKCLLDKVRSKGRYCEHKAAHILAHLLESVDECHRAGKAGHLILDPEHIFLKKSYKKVNISHRFHSIQYYLLYDNSHITLAVDNYDQKLTNVDV